MYLLLTTAHRTVWPGALECKQMYIELFLVRCRTLTSCLVVQTARHQVETFITCRGSIGQLEQLHMAHGCLATSHVINEVLNDY